MNDSFGDAQRKYDAMEPDDGPCGACEANFDEFSADLRLHFRLSLADTILSRPARRVLSEEFDNWIDDYVNDAFYRSGAFNCEKHRVD